MPRSISIFMLHCTQNFIRALKIGCYLICYIGNRLIVWITNPQLRLRLLIASLPVLPPQLKEQKSQKIQKITNDCLRQLIVWTSSVSSWQILVHTKNNSSKNKERIYGQRTNALQERTKKNKKWTKKSRHLRKNWKKTR